MPRSDCADWWAARYDRPWNGRPASPFQSRNRWVETKRRWPELFAEAVEMDARLRDGLAYVKDPYLHSLRMPLGSGGRAGRGGARSRRTERRFWQRVRGSLRGVT